MSEMDFITAALVAALVPSVVGLDALQRTGRSCKYDIDCVENAYCKEQSYCRCKANFLYWEGFRSCLPVVTRLGDPCEVDLQCGLLFGIHAECIQGACRCREGCHYKEMERRCYETARIGEKCQVTNNCLLDSGLPATCYNSVCTCPPGYKPSRDNRDCIKTAELGQSCISDEECVAGSSYCRDVCRCSVDHVESEKNKSLCLKAADEIGDPCEENAQCSIYLKQAICSPEGKCLCLPNHHFMEHSSKCWRDIYLNERCDNAEECVVTSGKADCVNGRCHCVVGSTKGNNNNCEANGRNTARTIFSVAKLVLFNIAVVFTYYINRNTT